MAGQANSKRRRTIGTRAILRYGFAFAGLCMLLTGAIYASQKFEQFVIRDPRFFLPGPADYGLESSNLRLEGVKYAPREQILRPFEPDYGRSLYLFPMAARRQALLNIRWVHQVSITRVWPNRVVVTITERKPAAFVRLPADNMVRWALIDEEGVILDPPQKASFRLPVLAGIQSGESAATRSTRVHRMQRLMTELGGLAENVSEVDASELDNLKITERVEGKGVSLMLGDRNFASRVQNFLDHYHDIHRRLPDAGTFDLRLDDRITGLEGAGDAR